MAHEYEEIETAPLVEKGEKATDYSKDPETAEEEYNERRERRGVTGLANVFTSAFGDPAGGFSCGPCLCLFFLGPIFYFYMWAAWKGAYEESYNGSYAKTCNEADSLPSYFLMSGILIIVGPCLSGVIAQVGAEAENVAFLACAAMVGLAQFGYQAVYGSYLAWNQEGECGPLGYWIKFVMILSYIAVGCICLGLADYLTTSGTRMENASFRQRT